MDVYCHKNCRLIDKLNSYEKGLWFLLPEWGAHASRTYDVHYSFFENIGMPDFQHSKFLLWKVYMSDGCAGTLYVHCVNFRLSHVQTFPTGKAHHRVSYWHSWLGIRNLTKDWFHEVSVVDPSLRKNVSTSCYGISGAEHICDCSRKFCIVIGSLSFVVWEPHWHTRKDLGCFSLWSSYRETPSDNACAPHSGRRNHGPFL